MGSRMVRNLVLVGALAAVAGFVVQGSSFGPGSAEAVDLPTADIAAGAIEHTVTAAGKLVPLREVDVGAQVSGQLQTLHVTEGDQVGRGDLLAEIDPTLARAGLVEAEASVDMLRADLGARTAEREAAAATIDRLRTLAARNIVTGAELQIAETQLAVTEAAAASLEAQIRQAEAVLDTARANMAYTRILAPMDGTIMSIAAREGQTLNANNEAPLILTIADLDRMRVEAEVSEADVARLSPGLDAYFTVLGGGGERWDGRLLQVLPQPIIDNQVVFYRALFEVDNADRRLKSQMTAQIFFVLESAAGVPLVPLAALEAAGRGGDEDRVTVRGADGRLVERVVTLGVRDEIRAAVLDGLSVGETVMLGGPAR
ncbi:MAG: efflux RND transporter periplasmic adaptor subunit [Rhizobiaceae bacterium]|nr:efflux RND transporter periplasmic adaptor subunit [Rhizobiaceae bacterium]